MLKRFVYGPEAFDYFHRCLHEDGNVLALMLTDSRTLQHGKVFADLPSEVDATQLYRFRTDIFWGWSDDHGKEIVQHLIDFLTAFLADKRERLVTCESWLDSAPPSESPQYRYFFCASTIGRPRRLYRYLSSDDGNEAQVRGFLQHNNRYPLILVDLSNAPEIMDVISSGQEVSKEALQIMVENTLNVIVPVYDGRANLVWERMSYDELREKWMKGNVEVM